MAMKRQTFLVLLDLLNHELANKTLIAFFLFHWTFDHQISLSFGQIEAVFCACVWRDVLSILNSIALFSNAKTKSNKFFGKFSQTWKSQKERRNFTKLFLCFRYLCYTNLIYFRRVKINYDFLSRIFTTEFSPLKKDWGVK